MLVTTWLFFFMSGEIPIIVTKTPDALRRSFLRLTVWLPKDTGIFHLFCLNVKKDYPKLEKEVSFVFRPHS